MLTEHIMSKSVTLSRGAPAALGLALSQAFSVHAQQAMPEVVVSAARPAAASHASIAGFGDAPLLQTPASVTAISRERMQDLQIRNVSEASGLDPSLNDSYNAVGYAEQFSIRGFNLDNASSYRKDGAVIPGDTQIPLENKERIEILKGIAGLQAGVTGPGGIVNFVTKRPTARNVGTATLEVRERGTVYGAADLGGRFADRRFGYRINAAAERLRSYVRGADGERQFVSAAFDWEMGEGRLLQLDMDYQRKSQISAPGYQLIRGVALPTGISPKTLLNNQPWSRPVETHSANIGLRYTHELGQGWRATFSANQHRFRRDDYTAFPYGCSNEGDGYYPGYCSNGDYDLYDYQSVGERKSPRTAQALLQGSLRTGTVAHALTLGWNFTRRQDTFGEYVYDYVGYSNIYRNLTVAPDPDRTRNIMRRFHDRENGLVVQDTMTLSPALKLLAGLRRVEVERHNYVVVDEVNGEDVYGWRQAKHSFVLPNVALVYSFATDWNVYALAAHGMEHGGIAPLGTSNANSVLAPSRSRQAELGVKGILGGSQVSAALFRVQRGFEFTNPAGLYMRGGDQTHTGLELSAEGDLSRELGYMLGLTALHMEQSGTGVPTFDGKRSTNVPAFKSTATLQYAPAAVPGLKLRATWQHAGKKAFDDANTVFVPGYHLFSLGASYATRVLGMSTTLRASVDNVADKFYWRDVTPLLGGYLLPGAPRTARVSAQFDF
jgi:iron complex outermembrane receptor protein